MKQFFRELVGNTDLGNVGCLFYLPVLFLLVMLLALFLQEALK